MFLRLSSAATLLEGVLGRWLDLSPSLSDTYAHAQASKMNVSTQNWQAGSCLAWQGVRGSQHNMWMVRRGGVAAVLAVVLCFPSTGGISLDIHPELFSYDFCLALLFFFFPFFLKLVLRALSPSHLP